MELEKISIFELIRKIYQLAKFNGGSFILEKDAVKRVFIEAKYDEAVLLYRDGGGDYATDAEGLAIFTAIKNYESENPEAYKIFMKSYEPYDDSQDIAITSENAAEFEKILQSKPS
jgi:hypothetical protein